MYGLHLSKKRGVAMSEKLRDALREIIEHVHPGSFDEMSEERALEIALAYAKGYREGVESTVEQPLMKAKQTGKGA